VTEPPDRSQVDPDGATGDEAVPLIAAEPAEPGTAADADLAPTELPTEPPAGPLPEPEVAPAGPLPEPEVTAAVPAEPEVTAAGPPPEPEVTAAVPAEPDSAADAGAAAAEPPDTSHPAPEGPAEPEVAGPEAPGQRRVQNGGARPASTSVLRSMVEWVTILGGALIVALVVTRFLIQAFFIPSLSMFPALDEGDRVLVNKLSYRLHEINRGDLIVFERPSDDGPGQVKDLIKRVVGLEGERIEGRGGRVLIDGRPLSEPYLAPGIETTDFEPVVVPAGHVFVMGDNRGDSRDSRFFGPLPEELVIGRAFVKVWPLHDLELL
jgi:signal peptidase I